jgi:hypothetical protein
MSLSLPLSIVLQSSHSGLWVTLLLPSLIQSFIFFDWPIAKASAAKTYSPILLVTNLIYLLLLFGRQRQSLETHWSFWLGMILTWALQGYSYFGILDHAESHNATSDKSLVGGAHLDVLAVTWVVQFGTVLWTPRFYWILAILPPWAGWTVYKNFRGGPAGTNSSNVKDSARDEPGDPNTDDRRKKRAEKRRQKWS